jgi:hypothetical protein
MYHLLAYHGNWYVIISWQPDVQGVQVRLRGYGSESGEIGARAGGGTGRGCSGPDMISVPCSSFWGTAT